MAILDAKGLREQIKNKLANVYYFYGSDILAVEDCTKKVLKVIGGLEVVTKLDGRNLDFHQLADEIEFCPMFAEYNCIYIHDCNMELLKESERKMLLQIVKQVPEQTVLVFDVTGFDIYGGKTGKNKKPTAQNKKLIDYIAKNGIVCCLESKNISQLATEIVAKVKKQGCMIERNIAQLLAMQCNCQSLLIQQEIDKLCAFVNGGLITEQIIKDMVVPQLETTVYMLTNAVLKYKTAEAIHAVKDLLALQMEMPYLMAIISNSFIDMQRACSARQNGKTVQDVMHDFGYQFSFAVERSFRDSMGESLEHIAKCLNLLCHAQAKMYSGAVDDRVLFEKTVIAMLER
ncbi:MAG: DNA polymerase III subunit delta [Oscillospiraceae bacterium]|nr:DNA polymerase III subunit delta [Oscillospiraceae bacterium]